MGFIEWFKRQKELSKQKNIAKEEALKSVYASELYKIKIAEAELKKIEQTGDSGFTGLMKKASQNAARNLASERQGGFDMSKLLNDGASVENINRKLKQGMTRK